MFEQAARGQGCCARARRADRGQRDRDHDRRGIRWRNGAGLNQVRVSTAPFPGFPTDLQAQLMALMTCAEGASQITGAIFKKTASPCAGTGAVRPWIQLDGETATIRHRRVARRAVMATDLRASLIAHWSSRDLPPRPEPWSTASTTSTTAGLRAVGGEALRLRRRIERIGD